MGKGRVCGLCASPELLNVAVRLRGVPGRLEFKGWDGERFPLANQSFNCVISCVPCGSYREPAAVVREMARVLRPEGDVYLPEADGVTPELPQGRGTADLERLLIEAGLGEVRWTRCDTAPGVVVHARQCSPGS